MGGGKNSLINIEENTDRSHRAAMKNPFLGTQTNSMVSSQNNQNNFD